MIGWSQDGGSGLSFTHADIMGMSLEELQRYAKLANRQRAREAKAKKDAAAQARSKRR